MAPGFLGFRTLSQKGRSNFAGSVLYLRCASGRTRFAAGWVSPTQPLAWGLLSRDREVLTVGYRVGVEPQPSRSRGSIPVEDEAGLREAIDRGVTDPRFETGVHSCHGFLASGALRPRRAARVCRSVCYAVASSGVSADSSTIRHSLAHGRRSSMNLTGRSAHLYMSWI